jgi:hypothetical protein
VAVATSAAATLTFIPLSSAADGTGVYAAWAVADSRTEAIGAFTGTVFPQIDAVAVDGSLSVARSATLTGTTPFGEEYGTSRGQTYLTSAITAGKSQGTVTLNFESSPNPLTWSFAVGDVDAENISLSALDLDGNEIDVRSWKYVPFNYASGETDQPVWDEETQTIVGNTLDTNGASMWVRPTSDDIASITLTQIRTSGFPQYQLWVAADVLTEADVAEPEANDNICTVTDTALVNGEFELPIIPARSFRQPNQRDVPGWNTTATDGKIEIWSTGFQGVVAQDGNQFAELNATQPSELYQSVDTVPGETLTWSLLHRARAAGDIGDTMSVNIGPEGGEPNATYTFTDALSAGWVRHTGEYTVPEGQTVTRFGFESGPTASGSRSIGNFLDDIYFTTTECLPADKKDGNTVEPEVSPSASPSPEVSESASPTASPTVTPTDDVSPTPSDSPSPSVTPSPDVTIFESPSPTPTSTATARPTTSPSPAPTPTTTTANPTTEPVPVAPRTPVVIDPVSDGGVPEGSTITSVEPNRDGRVQIVNDELKFTPKPGFIGVTEITFTVTTPEGDEQLTEVSVAVGKEQTVVTRWTAPKRLKQGVNRFGPGTFITNANQVAKVEVECLRILRNISGEPDPKCSVVVGKEGTIINVKVYEPTAVIVKMTAPKKGQYLPLDEEYVYRVDK